MTDSTEINIKTAELAEVLMLTTRRVQQLAQGGVLPRKTPRGPFDLIPAVQAYVRYLKESGGVSDEVVDGESHEQARTRLTKARADIHERTAMQLRGELIHADDIEAAWMKIVTMVRQHLIALPDRVAPKVQDAETLEETRGFLKGGVHEILQELSEAKVEFDDPTPTPDGASKAGYRSVENTARTAASSNS
jgi:phage terminase Nu1 subunit (DNA packaging protein)